MEQWIEIETCPRCGLSHALGFLGLIRATDEYNTWSNCPKTGQPILLKLERIYKVESVK